MVETIYFLFSLCFGFLGVFNKNFQVTHSRLNFLNLSVLVSWHKMKVPILSSLIFTGRVSVVRVKIDFLQES